jgi:hypothetical protein
MRKIDYDSYYDETTGNTENHVAADELMERKTFAQQQAGYEVGFASASGVRSETAETEGRVRYPEKKDESRPSAVVAEFDEENAGLAES